MAAHIEASGKAQIDFEIQSSQSSLSGAILFYSLLFVFFVLFSCFKRCIPPQTSHGTEEANGQKGEIEPPKSMMDPRFRTRIQSLRP